MRLAPASLLFSTSLFGFFLLCDSSAPANPTYVCPMASAALEDDTLYAFDGRTMTPVISASEFEAPQRKWTTLYFVVKTAGDDRAGAIVIKTARLGPQLTSDRPDYGRVLLRRSGVGSNCGSQRSYLNSVSTLAYEAYHDLGYDRGEILERPDGSDTGLTTLQHFHTGYDATDYASRDQKCRRTDDKKRYDGSYEARSNRSQFSFVTDIVDHGISGAASQAASGGFRWVASSSIGDHEYEIEKGTGRQSGRDAGGKRGREPLRLHEVTIKTGKKSAGDGEDSDQRLSSGWIALGGIRDCLEHKGKRSEREARDQGGKPHRRGQLVFAPHRIVDAELQYP